MTTDMDTGEVLDEEAQAFARAESFFDVYDKTDAGKFEIAAAKARSGHGTGSKSPPN